MDLPSKEYLLDVEEVRIIGLALVMQSMEDLIIAGAPHKKYPNTDNDLLERMAEFHRELAEQRNKIIKKLS